VTFCSKKAGWIKAIVRGHTTLPLTHPFLEVFLGSPKSADMGPVAMFSWQDEFQLSGGAVHFS
jgi:hypothetical protein